MARFDDHALFQMDQRGITVADVGAAIDEPDETETGATRISYLKRLPGRRVMLRVVASLLDPDYVIPAYFDRKKPCE